VSTGTSTQDITYNEAVPNLAASPSRQIEASWSSVWRMCFSTLPSLNCCADMVGRLPDPGFFRARGCCDDAVHHVAAEITTGASEAVRSIETSCRALGYRRLMAAR
jgi:hypothetical protein